MIVRDADRTLARCLESLGRFDEVLVYENGCNDSSAQIAASFANVRLIHGDFDGYGPTRNKAAELARHDWVLALDADERLDATAVSSVARLDLDAEPTAVHAFHRYNWLADRALRSRLGREQVKRLYHRRHHLFEGGVHERLLDQDGQRARARTLPGRMEHDPYRDLGQLFDKRLRYADPQLRKTRGMHPALALARGVWRFFRCYFFHYGLIDGWRGLVLSVAEGYGSFLKYAWGYAARRASSRS